MNSCDETTVLFRPVGPDELTLIQESDFSGFAPRLEGQTYFYPVQNEQPATRIVRDWNAQNPRIGAGFVTRFRVQRKYLNRFERKTVGGAIHKEYWIPAEELPEFRNIVGQTEVIAEFEAAPAQ